MYIQIYSFSLYINFYTETFNYTFKTADAKNILIVIINTRG